MFKIVRNKRQPSFEKNEAFFLAKLCEEKSEHPVGRAIVKGIEQRLSNDKADLVKQFSLSTTEKIDGEGVFSTVQQATGRKIEVMCGNARMMLRYDVQWSSETFRKKSERLEGENLTLVYVALNRRVELMIGI